MQVELPARLRIRGEQHLEPSIEQEPADRVGADAAAPGVARLDHQYSPAAAVAQGTGQSGETGADDRHVDRRGDSVAIAGGF